MLNLKSPNTMCLNKKIKLIKIIKNKNNEAFILKDGIDVKKRKKCVQ